MSAETTARIIQTIIAPTVLITACAIILNGIIGQYNTIGSRLSSLAHERLELLQKMHLKISWDASACKKLIFNYQL